jgi:hypothetical protein
MAIGARAQKACVAGRILLSSGTEVVHDLALGLLAGHIEVVREPVFGGNDFEEIVDRSRSDFSQHCQTFSRRFGKIAHGILRIVKK